MQLQEILREHLDSDKSLGQPHKHGFVAKFHQHLLDRFGKVDMQHQPRDRDGKKGLRNRNRNLSPDQNCNQQQKNDKYIPAHQPVTCLLATLQGEPRQRGADRDSEQHLQGQHRNVGPRVPDKPRIQVTANQPRAPKHHAHREQQHDRDAQTVEQPIEALGAESSQHVR